MAVQSVHSERLVLTHRAPLCSCAVLFQLVLIALVVVVPYIIAYATGGMWLFERCYRQQPSILFKHQMIAVTRGNTAGSQRIWSTSEQLNSMVQQQLTVPLIRSYEDDTNRDGIKDSLRLEMEVPLADTDQIYGLSLLLLFDCQIDEFVNLKMESAAYLDYSASTSGRSLFIDGELLLRQRDRLGWTGQRRVYDTPVVNMNSDRAQDYELTTILSQYLDRNETTHFVPRATFWTGDRASGQPFLLNATVRYPQQLLCYQPGFWQELKVGWMQYLAFLIPLYFLVVWLQGFVFGNRLIETVVVPPRVKFRTS